MRGAVAAVLPDRHLFENELTELVSLQATTSVYALFKKYPVYNYVVYKSFVSILHGS